MTPGFVPNMSNFSLHGYALLGWLPSRDKSERTFWFSMDIVLAFHEKIVWKTGRSGCLWCSWISKNYPNHTKHLTNGFLKRKSAGSTDTRTTDSIDLWFFQSMPRPIRSFASLTLWVKFGTALSNTSTSLRAELVSTRLLSLIYPFLYEWYVRSIHLETFTKNIISSKIPSASERAFSSYRCGSRKVLVFAQADAILTDPAQFVLSQ